MITFEEEGVYIYVYFHPDMGWIKIEFRTVCELGADMGRYSGPRGGVTWSQLVVKVAQLGSRGDEHVEP